MCLVLVPPRAFSICPKSKVYGENYELQTCIIRDDDTGCCCYGALIPRPSHFFPWNHQGMDTNTAVMLMIRTAAAVQQIAK